MVIVGVAQPGLISSPLEPSMAPHCLTIEIQTKSGKYTIQDSRGHAQGKWGSWICREYKVSISQKVVCEPPALEPPGMLIKAANTHTHTPPPPPSEIHNPESRARASVSSMFLTCFPDDLERTEVWKMPPPRTSSLAAQPHPAKLIRVLWGGAQTLEIFKSTRWF